MEKEIKHIEVIVNGQPKSVAKEDLTYQEVVEMALGVYEGNPNIAYTVLYFKGNESKPKGELVKGEILKIRNGIVINVTRTDRS